MGEKDELRDHLNFLVQGRIEASGLIVALSFGAFTILTLFENTQVLSVSWWALSSAYFFVFLGALLMFPRWATSLWEIEHIRKLLAREAKIFPPWYSESDKEKAMEQNSKGPRLIDRYFVPVARSIIIGMGIVLWVSIGFHCGFGSPELLNPACS